MIKAKLLESQYPLGVKYPPSGNGDCNLTSHKGDVMISSASQMPPDRSGNWRIPANGIVPKKIRNKDANGKSKGYARELPIEHGIAYVLRSIWQRSLHSSPRTGKPFTWRREAGVSDRETGRIA